MDISVFLAKVLGLYLLIMSVAMFSNMKRFKSIMNEGNNIYFLFVTGAMAIIMGILLVVSHNIWVADYRGLITLIGWLTLIKGTVRLVFPDYALKMIKQCTQSSQAYYITDLIVFILGVYLTYMGFMLS